MKKLLLSLGFILFCQQSAFATEDAVSIMQKVEKRFAGKAYKSAMTMKITPKGSKPKTRTFYWWGQSKGNQWDYLIKFQTPTNLKNSGLLVVGTKSATPAQWIFMSAVGKKQSRRVADSDKGNPFLGSDFAFIDFEKLETKDFNHKLIGIKPCGKTKCATIESRPKDSSFPYTKMIAEVALDRYTTQKSQLFTDATNYKTFTVKEHKVIDGIWTATRVAMTNHNTGSTSEISITEIKYSKSLNSSLFTDSYLSMSIF